jgi:hypothetical protein
MPFEIFPFLLGACLVFTRRLPNQATVLGVVLIGVATAALAGELLLPLPHGALALLRDSAAAGAGLLLAQIAARRTAARAQSGRP